MDYIEFTLKNLQAADDLLAEIETKISDLSMFPSRHALVDDPLLASLGIRFIPIKNYLAFYFVSKEDLTVNIVRFLYVKSNWTFMLKDSFSFA